MKIHRKYCNWAQDKYWSNLNIIDSNTMGASVWASLCDAFIVPLHGWSTPREKNTRLISFCLSQAAGVMTLSPWQPGAPVRLIFFSPCHHVSAHDAVTRSLFSPCEASKAVDSDTHSSASPPLTFPPLLWKITPQYKPRHIHPLLKTAFPKGCFNRIFFTCQRTKL